MAFGFEQQHKDIAGRVGRLRVGAKVVRTPALPPGDQPPPPDRHPGRDARDGRRGPDHERLHLLPERPVPRCRARARAPRGPRLPGRDHDRLRVVPALGLRRRRGRQPRDPRVPAADRLGDRRPARPPDAAVGRPRDGRGRARDHARPDRRGPGDRRRRRAPRGPGPGRALRGPPRGGGPGRERRRCRDRPDRRRGAAHGELPLPRPRPGRARGQARALARRLRPPLRRRPPGHVRARRRDGLRPLRLGRVRALREGGPVPDRPRHPRGRRARRAPLLLRGLPGALGRRAPAPRPSANACSRSTTSP